MVATRDRQGHCSGCSQRSHRAVSLDGLVPEPLPGAASIGGSLISPRAEESSICAHLSAGPNVSSRVCQSDATADVQPISPGRPKSDSTFAWRIATAGCRAGREKVTTLVCLLGRKDRSASESSIRTRKCARDRVEQRALVHRLEQDGNRMRPLDEALSRGVVSAGDQYGRQAAPRRCQRTTQCGPIHLWKIQIDYQAGVGFWNCACDQRAWPVEGQNPEARGLDQSRQRT